MNMVFICDVLSHGPHSASTTCMNEEACTLVTLGTDEWFFPPQIFILRETRDSTEPNILLPMHLNYE